MYLGNEDIHNIFWSAGIDSTFLVCRRLIIEKEPIQTYYFNFECDGYYKPYPKGRASREVEIKVMKKLRELIIKKFPYTEDLFPSLILVDEFPIHNIIYKKMRVLHEKYGYGIIKYIANGKLEIVFDKSKETKIVLESFIKPI